VREAVQADESDHAPRVTSAAAEVGGDPTVVVGVELVTCQVMECRLGSTSVEHP
jgi:hypothetical protein